MGWSPDVEFGDLKSIALTVKLVTPLEVYVANQEISSQLYPELSFSVLLMILMSAFNFRHHEFFCSAFFSFYREDSKLELAS